MRKIKRNDEVEVIAGKDKGKSGKVIQILDGKKLLIDKINIVKKHSKPTPTFQGGIIEKPAPVDISSVMLICPQCNQKTRVDKSKVINGKRMRSCKKCNEIIDKK